MKRHYLLLLAFLFILTGCVSKESTEFKNDKDNQKEMGEEIIRIGKEKYNIELEPNTDKVKFNWFDGFPTIDENSLLIPVKTTVEPIYTFDAQVFLEKEADGTVNVQEIDIDRSHEGLDGLGKHLVQYMYQEKYGEIISELNKYDKRVSVNGMDIDAVTSYHFEDEEEKLEIKKMLINDYNQGKFTNVENFDQLYNRYVPKWDKHLNKTYLPTISIRINETAVDGKDFDIHAMKRINYGLTNVIKHSNILPPANYSIYTSNSTTQESYHIYQRKTY